MTATVRLNPTDEMLHRAADTLGSSRIVQVLWTFRDPVPVTALNAAWDGLDQGWLSRRARSSTVPGGRRSWVPARNQEALATTSTPLTDATLTDWIDIQVKAPLPPGSSALWRLAAAPYGEGTLVSLTVPHFRCDGLGIFRAIGSGGDGTHRPSAGPGPLDDLVDLARQTLHGGLAAARWLPATLADPDRLARIRTALRPPAPARPELPAAPRFFTSAIFETDAARWEQQADAFGGTTNSLFVEIAANLVRAAGEGDPSEPFDVGIPVSLRRSGQDARANALVVMPLTVPGGPARHRSLRRTRQATKELLRATGEHSGTLVPEPLWHLLPERHAHRLKNPGAQQTTVVASNFGRTPEAIARFTGQEAAGIAVRTMNVPGVLPDRARLRASLCLLRTGDRLTVTVTGIPDRFGDATSLRRLVGGELESWGLTVQRWWGDPTSPPVKES
ncbi:hypothetical protein ACFFSH_08225 [Streptomyces filamentosus]|uniref:Uncharacterized protein n=1 Tax=Streptomyces filamentosus TaxID=67294 RepID=A0A919BRQ6_STRFL|nr:hypothetical protein [Streptomyces filamentosus]GHG10738.1 hypothetical protein GCM10017667_49380 [Streptomyces filamentosus]